MCCNIKQMRARSGGSSFFTSGRREGRKEGGPDSWTSCRAVLLCLEQSPSELVYHSDLARWKSSKDTCKLYSDVILVAIYAPIRRADFLQRDSRQEHRFCIYYAYFDET